MTTSAFLDSLLSEFPQLQVVAVEHIKANELMLPHVFMADVTRWVLGLSERQTFSSATEPAPHLAKILTFLERAFEVGDPGVRALISLSFIENLLGPSTAETTVRAALGPGLSAELKVVGMSR